MRRLTLVGVASSFLVLGGCFGSAEQTVVQGSAATSDRLADWEIGVAAPGADWPQMGEAELVAQHEETVRNFAEFRDIDPVPDVEMGPFLPPDERPQAFVDCIADQGFSASWDGRSTSFEPVPPEQSHALDVALYVCMVKVPSDPRLSEQLPRVQAEKQYSYLVEEVAPCIREKGYAVPEAPTETTWLESYYGGGATWDPYTEVPSEVALALIQTCGEHALGVWPEVP